MTPYAYYKYQWMSYDDEQSVKIKAKYAMHENFGAIMVWSVDTDDFLGLAGNGKCPLLRAISHNWNPTIDDDAPSNRLPEYLPEGRTEAPTPTSSITTTKESTVATTQSPIGKPKISMLRIFKVSILSFLTVPLHSRSGHMLLGYAVLLSTW